MITDWSKYPNFKESEFKCKYTGECNMNPLMMELLQSIRTEYGRPIFISSGFRSVKHPVEQEKAQPGEHTYGMAVDILCHGDNAVKLMKLALDRDIKRIGVHQKGNVNGRFIHLGIADKFILAFPVAIWTY